MHGFPDASLGDVVFRFRMHTISSVLLALVVATILFLCAMLRIDSLGVIPAEDVLYMAAWLAASFSYFFGIGAVIILFRAVPRLGYHLTFHERGIHESTYEGVKKISLNEVIHFCHRPLEPSHGKKVNHGKIVWNLTVRSRSTAINGIISFRPGSRAHRAAKALVDTFEKQLEKKNP